MKRRTFIITAAAAAVAVTIPIVYQRCNDGGPGDPLTTPRMLSRFCNKKTLREIGQGYRQQVPDEGNKERLTYLLLTDNTGKRVDISDNARVRDLLDKKIQEEFSIYKTIILDDWIITPTEARQCALLSLT